MASIYFNLLLFKTLLLIAYDFDVLSGNLGFWFSGLPPLSFAQSQTM